MRTANDPGAFLAAVQPAPLYNPMPSSATIRNTPRPRNASGFVCRLILRTSRGNKTISPTPIILERGSELKDILGDHVEDTYLPAVADMMAFPLPFPKVRSNLSPW